MLDKVNTLMNVAESLTKPMLQLDFHVGKFALCSCKVFNKSENARKGVSTFHLIIRLQKVQFFKL